MKTVLIISGSPRKGGNSDLLCDRFAEGAKEAGNEVEKIFLKDHNINYCQGCGACIHSHKCVQKDEMAKILEKLVRSDVIVMATPVYFYTMNGQMKTFIDRTAPLYEDISSKEFYFIVAAADENKGNMNRTIEGFRAFTSCLTNPIEKGIIYGTGAWNVGDIKGSKSMNEAYDMGKSS